MEWLVKLYVINRHALTTIIQNCHRWKELLYLCPLFAPYDKKNAHNYVGATKNQLEYTEIKRMVVRMFFSKKRESMMAEKENVNRRLLDDELFLTEELIYSINSIAPHGVIQRCILAVTDKRLIIIQIDKASKGHTTSLRFDDVIGLSKHEVIKQVNISINTANQQFNLAPFVKGEAEKMIHLIESKRF